MCGCVGACGAACQVGSPPCRSRHPRARSHSECALALNSVTSSRFAAYEKSAAAVDVHKNGKYGDAHPPLAFTMGRIFRTNKQALSHSFFFVVVAFVVCLLSADEEAEKKIRQQLNLHTIPLVFRRKAFLLLTRPFRPT